MSRVEEDKVSIGRRCREERERLGSTRAAVAESCGKTPQAIGEYERGASYPGSEALLGFARIGMDTQFILTGVRSNNIDQVAEEAGTYKVEKGVGALAKDEEILIEKYRQLDPKKRTHAQAVVDALAAKGATGPAGKRTRWR